MKAYQLQLSSLPVVSSVKDYLSALFLSKDQRSLAYGIDYPKRAFNESAWCERRVFKVLGERTSKHKGGIGKVEAEDSK